MVRESDAKFSKAQIAEEKRQAKVAKKLKQTLKYNSMADFIENEGVEYPQLQTQQVEPETVQPQEEEQSEELNEPVNDNVAEPVIEQAQEDELVI
ncbi:hypothetical protein, partial [Staphylococcus aureus]